LKPAKVFHDAVESSQPKTSDGQAGHHPARAQIISIAFDGPGERCLTADEGDAFILWDMNKAKSVQLRSFRRIRAKEKTFRKSRTFYSKKYGISHARFTHKPHNIIHASTKLDDHAIRYHSMHDNKYLSYFQGHTGR